LKTVTHLPTVVQLLREKYYGRILGIAREMVRVAAASGRAVPKKLDERMLQTLELLKPKSLGEEARRICRENFEKAVPAHVQKKKEEIRARKPRNAMEEAFIHSELVE
jgi:hypothetical protein